MLLTRFDRDVIDSAANSNTFFTVSHCIYIVVYGAALMCTYEVDAFPRPSSTSQSGTQFKMAAEFPLRGSV